MKTNETTEVKTGMSLDELQAVVDAPIWCEFALSGAPIRVECRRLGQAVDEQVRELRRRAQPPFLKDRGPSGDYDYTNAAYLAAKDKNEKIARALMIYAGCPAVAAKKPGLVVPEMIYDYVRGVLSETVLEILGAVIQGGGLELGGRVNFTSTSASES